MWVSTFAVSALASNFERMGKPFNPLLGETYELKRPDFRIVCEQVSRKWAPRHETSTMVNGKDSFAEEGTGLIWLLLHFSTTPNNAAIL